MKPGAPQPIPHELNNEDLQAEITRLAKEIQTGALNDAIRWAPLLQLATGEQQNRASRRSNRLSRLVAFAALAVSLASAIFSGTAVSNTRRAAESAARWEQQQIKLLQDVREELKATRIALEKVPPAIDQLRPPPAPAPAITLTPRRR